MEKKNAVFMVIITVLAVVIGLLGGYIISDKLVNKDNNEQNNNSINGNQNNTNIENSTSQNDNDNINSEQIDLSNSIYRYLNKDNFQYAELYLSDSDNITPTVRIESFNKIEPLLKMLVQQKYVETGTSGFGIDDYNLFIYFDKDKRIVVQPSGVYGDLYYQNKGNIFSIEDNKNLSDSISKEVKQLYNELYNTKN